MAESFKADPSWFRAWFVKVIEFAEVHWNRPESVFQHIPKMLVAALDTYNNDQPIA